MLKWSKRNLRQQSQKSIFKQNTGKLVPPTNNPLMDARRRSNTSSSNKNKAHETSFSLHSSKSDKTKLEKMMEQMMQSINEVKRDISGMKVEMATFKEHTLNSLEELKEHKIQSQNNANQWRNYYNLFINIL